MWFCIEVRIKKTNQFKSKTQKIKSGLKDFDSKPTNCCSHTHARARARTHTHPGFSNVFTEAIDIKPKRSKFEQQNKYLFYTQYIHNNVVEV